MPGNFKCQKRYGKKKLYNLTVLVKMKKWSRVGFLPSVRVGRNSFQSRNFRLVKKSPTAQAWKRVRSRMFTWFHFTSLVIFNFVNHCTKWTFVFQILEMGKCTLTSEMQTSYPWVQPVRGQLSNVKRRYDHKIINVSSGQKDLKKHSECKYIKQL